MNGSKTPAVRAATATLDPCRLSYGRHLGSRRPDADLQAPTVGVRAQ